MTNNQELLVDHLKTRQEEVAGVSLDEETVHMLQYQRTYQAAARVMTTVDEMLDKVINGMGLVGR
jgi:flagellar hook-associated protein 1 FlgK